MNDICLPTTALLGLRRQDNVSHLYTIPVEWIYGSITDGKLLMHDEPSKNIKQVSKVMCVCGDIKNLNVEYTPPKANRKDREYGL